MEFWPYPTCFSTLRDKLPPELRDLDAFYRAVTRGVVSQDDQIGPKQGEAEHQWLLDSRPYFHVYPEVVDLLCTPVLDLDTGSINLPRRALAVCLPRDQRIPEMTFKHGHVQSILMTKGSLTVNAVSYDAIHLFIDVGEEADGCPIPTFASFRTAKGCTLQGELDTLPEHPSAHVGLVVPRPLIVNCVRLCAAICLVAVAPRVLEPDILKKDRKKWEATRDTKYIDKAHRRGKVGWLLGRDPTRAREIAKRILRGD